MPCRSLNNSHVDPAPRPPFGANARRSPVGATWPVLRSGCAVTTGKIERFHGTLRRELLDGRGFTSKTAAQQAVAAFVHEYNTDRPHQSIGRCTPAERFTAGRDDTASTGPALDDRALTAAIGARRDGPEWVTRAPAPTAVLDRLNALRGVG